MTKKCITCGKDFYIKDSHAHLRINCSKACMTKMYQGKMKGSGNPNYKNAGQKECEFCKGQFQAYNKNRIFCSKKCSGASRTEEKRIRNQRYCKFCKSPISGHQERICIKCRHICTCIICGKKFKNPNKAKTCSKFCRAKHYHNFQNGEKSHLWKGGKTTRVMIIRTSYQYKFWRTAVFERDDYTCQHCGQRGGKLNADHIKPFSQFPELVFDVNNGRTLCLDCHRKTPTWGRGFIKSKTKLLTN